MEPLTVLDLHGDLEGQYVLQEQRPDGSLVIRPEPTLTDALADQGERRVPAGEMPDWFQTLPSDGEG